MFSKAGPEPEPESFGNSQQNSARLSTSAHQRTNMPERILRYEEKQCQSNILRQNRNPTTAAGEKKPHKQSRILQFFKQGFQAVDNNSNKALQ